MRRAWLQRTAGAANAVVARCSRRGMAEIRTAAPVRPTDALRRVQTGITAQGPAGLTDQRPNAACFCENHPCPRDEVCDVWRGDDL
jgi:hypothetical protein